MEQKQGVDLDQVDVRPRSQHGVPLQIVDPVGRPMGITFTVRGTDSKAYKDKIREQIGRGVARLPRKMSEEEKNAEFWELHAMLIAGWTGMRLKGEDLAYSPELAARILEDYDWIFEQVRRFADNRANFLPGSSSS